MANLDTITYEIVVICAIRSVLADAQKVCSTRPIMNLKIKRKKELKTIIMENKSKFLVYMIQNRNHTMPNGEESHVV